ncbi:hypothetical protein E4T56_gene6685 [Termitomyces sp. T112]|nr:hypothetical protein E4T56_gene6685 [Termitomyces sp. T112]
MRSISCSDGPIPVRRNSLRQKSGTSRKPDDMGSSKFMTDCLSSCLLIPFNGSVNRFFMSNWTVVTWMSIHPAPHIIICQMRSQLYLEIFMRWDGRRYSIKESPDIKSDIRPEKSLDQLEALLRQIENRRKFGEELQTVRKLGREAWSRTVDLEEAWEITVLEKNTN